MNEIIFIGGKYVVQHFVTNYIIGGYLMPYFKKRVRRVVEKIFEPVRHFKNDINNCEI